MSIFQYFTIFSGALLLGATHAFESDHLSAVSAFVSGRPSPRTALHFGFRWAIGHGLSLMALAIVLVALRTSLSDAVVMDLERVVGLALLAVGLWTLRQVLFSDTNHVHSKHESSFFGIVGMGMIHGAAGTAAFVAEAMVAVSGPNNQHLLASMLGFAAFFSLGVAVAMSVYGFFLGKTLNLSRTRSSNKVFLVLRSLGGVWACSLGLVKMLG